MRGLPEQPRANGSNKMRSARQALKRPGRTKRGVVLRTDELLNVESG